MRPRTALVTGGASGIGAAIVALLEHEGAEVQVLDLRDGFDVSDPLAWEAVGPVELACLNAGVLSGGDDLAAYRRIIGVNVDGVVLGVLRLAEVMEPGSAIVVTASLAALEAMASDPFYTLTKHAVVGFVRGVAPRLAERGLRINAVCPGIVDTPLVPEEQRAALAAAGFPLIRPEAVAEAALLAARSDVTGGALVVQPGREPVWFRFPGVPGPRGSGAGARPPI